VVSYDDRQALRDYVEGNNIPFPMLSDFNSRVIRQYGILNTDAQPGDVPIYGCPYPGTYVADEEGIVIQRFFLESYKRRENPYTLIDTALGRISLFEDEPDDNDPIEEIRVRVGFQGGAVKQGAQRRVIVRFEMSPGLHIYNNPVPEGMIPVEIKVSGPDGLIIDDPITPPTHKLHLSEMNVDLAVWSGVTDIQVPVYALSSLASELRPLQDSELEINVSIRYQACTDNSCLLPRTESFTLAVPIETIDVPNLGTFKGKGQKDVQMDSKRHMRRLILRTLRRNPLAFFSGIKRLIKLVKASKVRQDKST